MASRSAATLLVAGALATTLAASGCSGVAPPVHEETLIAVIVDLHLLEARRELVADAHPALRDSVLGAHGVTHEELQDAIRYFTDRPDEYVSIYNRVIDSLTAEEADLEEAGIIGAFPPP
jgi:hypothetical protein